MAIRNIIQKAEQEYPPVVGGVSGDLSIYYTKDNPSGFITTGDLVDLELRIAGDIVYTTGNQTVSGIKDFTSRPTVNTVPVLLSGEVNTVISGVFFTAEVNIKNDNGSTIFKGQPVYVSSAAGTNILVKLASNTGEATSSKTFGLVNQSSLAQNANGTVVTEGLLQNVNTSAAGNEGDPIWLGTTGDLIYGLTNKPKAPNHLVYLGVVTKKHATQGEIFVHIQNGFEIDELHDVRIINKQNRDVIIYNSGSGLWLNRQLNINDISGSNNIVYTTGDQTISGNKTFQANEYNFDGADISIYGGGTFEVNASVETKGIPKDLGGVSGLQVMTTGAYNSGIPLSGVVYILI
jgi:hypothetical protein